MNHKSVFLSMISLLLFGCGGQTSSSASSTGVETSLSSSSQAKSIIVFFSATGTTKTIAEKIKAIISSDEYEIVPAVLYTSEDLNYNDSSSRATKEQRDDTARPEIGSETIDLTSYDLIYLGYPIWWGQAPKIMYTFVEGHSFKDKTVVPFVTSASSSIGTSAENLSKCADDGDWKKGTRFSSSVSDADLSSWLDICLN